MSSVRDLPAHIPWCRSIVSIGLEPFYSGQGTNVNNTCSALICIQLAITASREKGESNNELASNRVEGTGSRTPAAMHAFQMRRCVGTVSCTLTASTHLFDRKESKRGTQGSLETVYCYQLMIPVGTSRGNYHSPHTRWSSMRCDTTSHHNVSPGDCSGGDGLV